MEQGISTQRNDPLPGWEPEDNVFLGRLTTPYPAFLIQQNKELTRNCTWFAFGFGLCLAITIALLIYMSF